MTVDEAYSDANHVEFKISNIQWEEDAARTPGEIEPQYGSPAISVDTKGRFVKHEIIGGTTVRQKIGENPVEVSINGVCGESVARDLDALRDAKWGDIFSGRFPSDSLRVQFASVSTSPMEDSGAVPLDGDQSEFLYNYDLSCIEVLTG